MYSIRKAVMLISCPFSVLRLLLMETRTDCSQTTSHVRTQAHFAYQTLVPLYIAKDQDEILFKTSPGKDMDSKCAPYVSSCCSSRRRHELTKQKKLANLDGAETSQSLYSSMNINHSKLV